MVYVVRGRSIEHIRRSHLRSGEKYYDSYSEARKVLASKPMY